MKLPFQPSLIHPNFFRQYISPIEINYGDCFKWAWVAHKLFEDVELWSHESHAMIKRRGRFYDSEALDGIKNWRRLRTIKDNSGIGYPSAEKMSAFSFIPFWNCYNKCDWNALNAKINFFGQSMMTNGNSFG